MALCKGKQSLYLARAYPGFLSLRRVGVLPLPPGLGCWFFRVERGTVIVKYFDQEPNKMTRLALEPRLQRINHWATACSTKYLVGG